MCIDACDYHHSQNIEQLDYKDPLCYPFRATAISLPPPIPLSLDNHTSILHLYSFVISEILCKQNHTMLPFAIVFSHSSSFSGDSFRQFYINFLSLLTAQQYSTMVWMYHVFFFFNHLKADGHFGFFQFKAMMSKCYFISLLKNPVTQHCLHQGFFILGSMYSWRVNKLPAIINFPFYDGLISIFSNSGQGLICSRY